MDSSELKSIEDGVRSWLNSAETDQPKADNFMADKRARKDAKRFTDQTLGHRERLLNFLTRLSIASLSFLIAAVIFQMIVRLFIKDYNGVSDVVIETITVGVFGQIIGVVAIVVQAVWRKQDIV